jgi:hypothetical protein
MARLKQTGLFRSLSFRGGGALAYPSKMRHAKRKRLIFLLSDKVGLRAKEIAGLCRELLVTSAGEELYDIASRGLGRPLLSSLCRAAWLIHLPFRDLDRQLEINQPRLQERQRQHIFRVDIMRAVTGVSSDIEL